LFMVVNLAKRREPSSRNRRRKKLRERAFVVRDSARPNGKWEHPLRLAYVVAWCRSVDGKLSFAQTEV
jgi:hypothetical protein